MNQQSTPSAVAFGDQSVATIVAQIADPAHLSGGGAVAAVTLAGAAAVVELVLRLARERPSQASRRAEIEQLLAELHELGQRALGGAEQDLAAFKRLMAAQQDVKDAADEDKAVARDVLQQTWLDAASAPAALAADGLALLEIVARALPFGTRFTVSDLGAGAALASGTIGAALLTAEANLSYVAGERGAALRQRCHQIRSTARKLENDIEERTRERIENARRKKTEKHAQA